MLNHNGSLPYCGIYRQETVNRHYDARLPDAAVLVDGGEQMTRTSPTTTSDRRPDNYSMMILIIGLHF